MDKPCLWLACVLFAALSVPAGAQQKNIEAAVMFKDGFYVKGVVHEKRDFLVDPASGQSIPIPASGGFMYVDDNARRIHFDPNQVDPNGIIPLTPAELQGRIILKRYDYYQRKDQIAPSWTFENVGPWNDKWERRLTINTHYNNRTFDVRQRILLMTPQVTQAVTVSYAWDLCFLTQELGPETTRSLVYNYYKSGKEKDLSEPERLLQVAVFLQKAGWQDAAEKELVELAKAHPDYKKGEEVLQAVRELRAGTFVDDMERAAQLGQHREVQDKLVAFEKDKIDQYASAKHRLTAQDLKTRYETFKLQLDDAKILLNSLPPLVPDGKRKFWSAAARALFEELNLETLPRLETFLSFGKQHQNELSKNEKPAQSTEEVLALAVTGWLQGNQAAEPDAAAAQKLFQARRFLLDYLKHDTVFARNEALSGFGKDNNLPLDVMARLVRLMPPSHAQEKLGTEPMELTVDIPEAESVKYLVQLPPDYSHFRPHPVLILLHSGLEQPDKLMERWTEHAARYGFILAAPYWGKGLRPTYEFSAREHRCVLDVLRDLRRRFQVDSDRVFLFGWEQGATMAFDVGLSHPDQFAGVLPMNGGVHNYTQRYWPNAQYLPFYIVEGDRNGGNPKATRNLYKEWIRSHYAALYVEYKGRATEWFAGEMPQMMNWMSRKKRSHPLRQVGRYHTGGSAGSGEEFKTMRQSDNRFYWLSTEAIKDSNLNDHANFSVRKLPATLQADLGVGNELDKKGANIWSQFNIRTSGVKQVSLLLEGGVIDFAKPVRIRVNGDQIGSDRVIAANLQTMLDDLAATGDRQRLIFARVDVRLR
jgi:pimeloyl-ACP methyl ester carboxylesterase